MRLERSCAAFFPHDAACLRPYVGCTAVYCTNPTLTTSIVNEGVGLYGVGDDGTTVLLARCEP